MAEQSISSSAAHKNQPSRFIVIAATKVVRATTFSEASKEQHRLQCQLDCNYPEMSKKAHIYELKY